MLMYLHAKNKHPRSNLLGEMNQKPTKGIFTPGQPFVAAVIEIKNY